MQNHDQLIQSYMDIQSPNHVGWKNMGFFMTIHYHITDKMVVKECQLKSPLALPSPVILCSRLNISKVSSKKWVERVEDEDVRFSVLLDVSSLRLLLSFSVRSLVVRYYLFSRKQKKTIW